MKFNFDPKKARVWKKCKECNTTKPMVAFPNDGYGQPCQWCETLKYLRSVAKEPCVPKITVG